MSRENKFRGQRVDTKEWVYGSLVECGATGKKYIFPCGCDVNESDRVGYDGCLMLVTFEVIDDTVGQFTGLHDKNGAEIYDGDICIGKRGGESYEFTVKWDEEDARFLGYTNNGYICYVGQEPCVEVIGNIHEMENK